MAFGNISEKYLPRFSDSLYVRVFHTNHQKKKLERNSSEKHNNCYNNHVN